MPFKKSLTLPGRWERLAFLVFKGIGAFEGRVEKSLEKYKKAFQSWIVKAVVTGLSIFISLVFLVLGLFFIAMDYGGVPRGVVFTCGGLLGLLILRLMVPPTK